MPEPALRQGVRASLVALVLAAVWAFARRQPVAALAGVAGLASFFWQAHLVPGRLSRAAVSAARIAAAAAGVLAFVHTLYPVMSERTVATLAATIGFALAALAAALLLGAGGTAAEGAIVLTAVALLVVASLDPADPLLLPQALAGAAALAYLVASIRIAGRGRAVKANRVRRFVALAVASAATTFAAVAIARLLPWAQPQVEQTTANLFTPSSSFAQAGFSETSSLGDIERLALSRTVVMRVWTPTPRKLRARVLTEFNGRSWRTARPVWRDLAPSSALSEAPLLRDVPGRDFLVRAPGGRPTVTRVLRVVRVTDILLSPSAPQALRADVPRLRIDEAGVVTPTGAAPDLYAVVHEDAPLAVSAPPGPEALALPPRLDPRIRALAESLAASASTPRARLDHTLRFLDAEYQYTLAPGRFRTASPLAEFLFEKKAGYCEYFATAGAVLLRLQGVPTRYVTGFAMSDGSRVAGHFVVRESDAHAWIEAWVDGRWVEADPTPAADYEAVRAPLREGALGRLATWVAGRWAEVWMAVRFGRRGLVAAAVIALAAGAVLAWRRRRSRVRPQTAGPPPRDDAPAPDLRRLLDRVDAAWAARGAPRPPHRAPLEHLELVPERDLPGDLRAATQAAVEGYYRARFGGVPLTPEELAALSAALEPR